MITQTYPVEKYISLAGNVFILVVSTLVVRNNYSLFEIKIGQELYQMLIVTVSNTL
jgi:hypothetical protein